MGSLTMWFTSGPSPQLFKTQFSHPLLDQPSIAFRGRASFSDKSFPWTAGVQGACVVILDALIASLDGGEDQVLKGERGSLASSLDSSIVKHTNWITDVFGTDSKGRPIAHRLFNRSNSCLKRPGPVTVALNKSQLSVDSIQILVDERRIVALDELKVLRRAVSAPMRGAVAPARNPGADPEGPPDRSFSEEPSGLDNKTDSWRVRVEHFMARQRELGPLPKPFWDPVARAFLRSIFVDEIRRMLVATNIFNQSTLNETVRDISHIPWCQTLVKENSRLVSEIDLKLSCAERVGCLTESQLRAGLCNVPVRVAVSPTYAPSVALFTFLKLFKGYNVEILFHFSNSYEVVRAIEGGDEEAAPNACVLSVAAAEEMVKAHRALRFSPLMFMPHISHRIVGPKQDKVPRSDSFAGHYLFWSGSPSGPLLYFNRMKNQKMINSAKTKITHLEPDRIAGALNDGDRDLRGILWFPFYHFNVRYNDCALIDERNASSLAPQLLFVHESLSAKSMAGFYLDVAVRDAWLELTETPGLIESVVDVMLEDRSYIRLLCRFGGLHNQRALIDMANPLNNAAANS